MSICLLAAPLMQQETHIRIEPMKMHMIIDNTTLHYLIKPLTADSEALSIPVKYVICNSVSAKPVVLLPAPIVGRAPIVGLAPMNGSVTMESALASTSASTSAMKLESAASKSRSKSEVSNWASV